MICSRDFYSHDFYNHGLMQVTARSVEQICAESAEWSAAGSLGGNVGCIGF
jgi:hypothetical protein